MLGRCANWGRACVRLSFSREHASHSLRTLSHDGYIRIMDVFCHIIGPESRCGMGQQQQQQQNVCWIVPFSRDTRNHTQTATVAGSRNAKVANLLRKWQTGNKFYPGIFSFFFLFSDSESMLRWLNKYVNGNLRLSSTSGRHQKEK